MVYEDMDSTWILQHNHFVIIHRKASNIGNTHPFPSVEEEIGIRSDIAHMASLG